MRRTSSGSMWRFTVSLNWSLQCTHPSLHLPSLILMIRILLVMHNKNPQKSRPLICFKALWEEAAMTWWFKKEGYGVHCLWLIMPNFHFCSTRSKYEWLCLPGNAWLCKNLIPHFHFVYMETAVAPLAKKPKDLDHNKHTTEQLKVILPQKETSH